MNNFGVGFFAYCHQEHRQNEIHYKIHLSTLFRKRNTTFHGAFLLRLSVFVKLKRNALYMPTISRESHEWLFFSFWTCVRIFLFNHIVTCKTMCNIRCNIHSFLSLSYACLVYVLQTLSNSSWSSSCQGYILHYQPNGLKLHQHDQREI